MSTFLLFLGTLLSFVSHCAFEDQTVLCVLLKSCVLPCSFEPGTELVLNWLKEPHDYPVHIYYYGQNQLQDQHQNFTGRTSLFEKELSRGNASLLLSEVRGQDEGTYTCFTSVNRVQETHVTLRVEAPVLEVFLQQEPGRLHCKSKGLFPKPSVSWSPEPVDKPETFIFPSGHEVWSVVSSVSLTHKPPYEYSCNVSTPHSWRSATYRRNSVVHHLGVSVYEMIPCIKSNTPVKSLIWRFHHTQTILNRTGPELVYTESWRGFVEEVTESNSLVLKDLTQDQMGLFSCELSTEKEMFFIHTEVTWRKSDLEDLFTVFFGYILVLLILGSLYAFLRPVCRRPLNLRISERLRGFVKSSLTHFTYSSPEVSTLSSAEEGRSEEGALCGGAL